MVSKLGIDIGGTIIDRRNDAGDKDFFTKNYLNVPEIKDAFWVIKELNKRFDNQVFLISACTEQVEINTMQWFEYHSFFAKTNITKEHIYFCRYRKIKNDICEQLNITHFIDDRIEVLQTLVYVKNLYHLSGDQTWPDIARLVHP